MPSWLDKYLQQIQTFEGYAPKAQWDYKQYTNGYGTRAAYPGEVIDRDTAAQRFSNEIDKARSSVDAFAPNAPVGVKAALTSLTYNAGPGWQKQTLGEDIRNGRYDQARQHFVQYDNAGGRELPALVSRRNAEAKWFGDKAEPQGAYTVADAGSVPNILKTDYGRESGPAFAAASPSPTTVPDNQAQNIATAGALPSSAISSLSDKLKPITKSLGLPVFAGAFTQGPDQEATKQNMAALDAAENERLAIMKKVLAANAQRRLGGAYA